MTATVASSGQGGAAHTKQPVIPLNTSDAQVSLGMRLTASPRDLSATSYDRVGKAAYVSYRSLLGEEAGPAPSPSKALSPLTPGSTAPVRSLARGNVPGALGSPVQSGRPTHLVATLTQGMGAARPGTQAMLAAARAAARRRVEEDAAKPAATPGAAPDTVASPAEEQFGRMTVRASAATGSVRSPQDGNGGAQAAPRGSSALERSAMYDLRKAPPSVYSPFSNTLTPAKQDARQVSIEHEAAPGHTSPPHPIAEITRGAEPTDDPLQAHPLVQPAANVQAAPAAAAPAGPLQPASASPQRPAPQPWAQLMWTGDQWTPLGDAGELAQLSGHDEQETAAAQSPAAAAALQELERQLLQGGQQGEQLQSVQHALGMLRRVVSAEHGFASGGDDEEEDEVEPEVYGPDGARLPMEAVTGSVPPPLGTVIEMPRPQARRHLAAQAAAHVASQMPHEEEAWSYPEEHLLPAQLAQMQQAQMQETPLLPAVQSELDAMQQQLSAVSAALAYMRQAQPPPATGPATPPPAPMEAAQKAEAAARPAATQGVYVPPGFALVPLDSLSAARGMGQAAPQQTPPKKAQAPPTPPRDAQPLQAAQDPHGHMPPAQAPAPQSAPEHAPHEEVVIGDDGQEYVCVTQPDGQEQWFLRTPMQNSAPPRQQDQQRGGPMPPSMAPRAALPPGNARIDRDGNLILADGSRASAQSPPGSNGTPPAPQARDSRGIFSPRGDASRPAVPLRQSRGYAPPQPAGAARGGDSSSVASSIRSPRMASRRAAVPGLNASVASSARGHPGPSDDAEDAAPVDWGILDGHPTPGASHSLAPPRRTSPVLGQERQRAVTHNWHDMTGQGPFSSPPPAAMTAPHEREPGTDSDEDNHMYTPRGLKEVEGISAPPAGAFSQHHMTPQQGARGRQSSDAPPSARQGAPTPSTHPRESAPPGSVDGRSEALSVSPPPSVTIPHPAHAAAAAAHARAQLLAAQADAYHTAYDAYMRQYLNTVAVASSSSPRQRAAVAKMQLPSSDGAPPPPPSQEPWEVHGAASASSHQERKEVDLQQDRPPPVFAYPRSARVEGRSRVTEAAEAAAVAQAAAKMASSTPYPLPASTADPLSASRRSGAVRVSDREYQGIVERLHSTHTAASNGQKVDTPSHSRARSSGRYVSEVRGSPALGSPSASRGDDMPRPSPLFAGGAEAPSNTHKSMNPAHPRMVQARQMSAATDRATAAYKATLRQAAAGRR